MSWCGSSKAHARTGLVSNQDRAKFDTSKTLVSVATCEQEACIRKAQKYVAGETNQTATYQSDAAAGVA